MSTEATASSESTVRAESTASGGELSASPMTDVESRVMEAADELFYAHGVQAVGMDRIRDASGVSLKRLYQCYPSKVRLVEAYLRHRDQVARTALAAHVADIRDPEERVLAVFDWLYAWSAQLGFRGCVFNNIFGELGGDSEIVVRVVRQHKAGLREFFLGLSSDLGVSSPADLTDQLLILFNGAITVASVNGVPDAALHARSAAISVMEAAKSEV